MDDLKNVGESNYNPGDGTDQRVQSLVFMMMMMRICIIRKEKYENALFRANLRTDVEAPHQSAHTDLKILQWNARGMA